MVENKFRNIIERDIDILILEEFSTSKQFSKIFLSKIQINDATIVSTWQSKTDNTFGESDMTVVFDCNDKKIALLIENKIDACAMPTQPQRYILRGNKGVADKEYDEYFVFIVAPEKYLQFNDKAQDYPYQVSYEEIRDYFNKENTTRNNFKLAQINLAIEKQKFGYQTIKDSRATEFWNKYIEYQKRFFPELRLIVNSAIKPTNGIYTYFKTNNNSMLIYHKTDKGYVDLTINGQADNIIRIKSIMVNILGDYYSKGFSVVKTGKSCAIRICVHAIDFLKPFNEQMEYVEESFKAVKSLFELSNQLDMVDTSLT